MKTVYINGNVYTGCLPLQEAFSVEGGLFGPVGKSQDIRALIQPGDRVVDLEGRFVCAGFNDSHMHLLNYGQSLFGAPLAQHTHSKAALLSCLRDYLSQNPPAPGKWLTGRGWNQDYFTDTSVMPGRRDLDEISREIPILITRACGHCCVVNSRVLELAGINASTPDPEGGSIGRDEEGRPDGRLFERAIDLIDRVKPLPDKEDLKAMLRLAMKQARRYGVTSVQSDDYSTFGGLSWELINEAYRELEAAGEMQLRVYEQCNFPEMSDLKDFLAQGNRTGRGSDLFRTGPLKMLGDGSLGSRTAHLSMPYQGGGGEKGFSLFSPAYMKQMIALAHQNGMQTAVHAIGDACLDEVLEAMEAAQKDHPRPDPRHGIVHCQISRPDQLERIARLGLHVYAQSIFLDYDNHIVEKLVPPALSASSYSWKSLLKMEVSVSNGSDCPVELPNVMAGIQCAVTRSSLDGTGPFLPREAFTVQEALDSFTIAGARASFEEHKKGRIREGMLADFVILGEDPFACDAFALHRIPVLESFLGGQSNMG